MTHQIYGNVTLGSRAEIGNHVIIGLPIQTEQDGVKTIIGEGAVIRSHTIIYEGNSIGTTFRTGHSVMVREANTIGNDVSIGTHSIVEHHVEIASGVRIHSAAFVPEYSVLEEGAWIGPHVVLTNAPYPLSPNAKATLQGPRVCRGAKVGANSTLLPGVVIGKHALVGAGTVVTRDVPEFAVVVGNPARVINDVRELGDYANSNL